MSRPQRFDWPRLMEAGLCRLRMSPAQFWALTPAEFLMLMGEGAGVGPLDRRRLDALLARYPDEARNPDPEGEVAHG